MSASRPSPDSHRSAPGSLSWIVPILFLAGMGGWFYYAGSDRARPAPPDASAQEEQLRISHASAIPCNVPLRWRIEVDGSDAAEGAETLWAAVRAAAGIWESGVERSLFQAHATEGFPVRFTRSSGAVGDEVGVGDEADPAEPVVRFVERVRVRSGRVISVERAVEIGPGVDPEHLVLLLARELGHALGLPDTDATGALMNPRTRLEGREPSEFPTAADTEALRRACAGG
ncbi:MAG: hypothetical protein EA422_08765 [Gemmatimonadales bacterium]|nr:MAG: hypothetical protein EA422_08765 [Gemmatimonadales bacterium]